MRKWPLEPRLYTVIEQIDEQTTQEEDAKLSSSAGQVSDEGIILEINPYQGRTTAVLTCSCTGLNSQVYCIDQWTHTYLQQWLDNMGRLGVASAVLPLKGDPLEILRVMGPHLALKKVELVVIHGRQTLTETLAIFMTCLSFLQVGRRIIFHKTKDCEEYFGQFWTIAQKILHNTDCAGSLYYGIKA